MFAQFENLHYTLCLTAKSRTERRNLRSIVFMEFSWNNLVVISDGNNETYDSVLEKKRQKTITFNSNARRIVED